MPEERDQGLSARDALPAAIGAAPAFSAGLRGGRRPVNLRDRLGRERAALVVVDMQLDFCDPAGAVAGYGADVSGAAGIVPRVNGLIAAARAVAVPVIFTRMENDDSTESPAFAGRDLLGGRSTVCRSGTRGAS